MMDFGNLREGLEDKYDDVRQNPVSYWAAPAVFTVFLTALFLRYRPEQGMKYLQALDPYWIFRQSQHLALDGNIPTTDFMRYFPYNAPFHHHNVGEIVIPAAMYKMGGSLFFNSYMEWAQFFPAFMGALSTVATYFLGKEMFDKYTGISAAFLLATVGGVMHRTSAGFFEKEPVGTLFMIISMYFFTRGWKRKERISGIFAGLALGIFTISWGGSKMLWLLLPLVVGITAFLDQDIEELVAVYTPTVLVAGGFAAAANPSRFGLTGSMFLGNIAILGLLWTRYLVEKLEIVERDKLAYFVPSISAVGLIMVALSPLYSQFIYSRFSSIISRVTQSGGAVIAGTVAENTASSIGDMAGTLGASNAGVGVSRLLADIPVIGDGALRQIMSVLGSLLGGYSGAWTLAIIGIPVIGSKITLMVLRRYGVVEEEIGWKKYLGYMQASIMGWFAIIAGFAYTNTLQSANAIQSLYRIETIAAGALIFLISLSIVYFFDEDEAFQINSLVTALFTAGVAILPLQIGNLYRANISQALFQLPFSSAVFHPLLLSVTGIGLLYYFKEASDYKIEMKSYQILGLVWAITNILGAAAKSRLVFLSAFSSAFLGGYMVSRIYLKARELDRSTFNIIGGSVLLLVANVVVLAISSAYEASNLELIGFMLLLNTPLLYVALELEDEVKGILNSSNLKKILAGVFIVAFAAVNFSSGFAASDNLGGSPNQLWMQNLDYMESETPGDSVVLSWWDYGYWFESVGRRAAVADGGNAGYYTSDILGKTNYPIADFLTSTNPSNHSELFKKHSIDYIVLDETMIGKYSAVSQIAHRDNSEFDYMTQLTWRGNSQNSNQSTFSDGRRTVYAEIKSSNNSIDLKSQDTRAIYETATGRSRVGCVVTEDGIKELDVEKPAQLSGSEMCIAENPFYTLERAAITSQRSNMQTQPAKLVIVPKKVARSSLGRLYLMDGYGIDWVEKVEGGSNGFIKMWKVNQQEIEE
ncbi:MAG: glycosyltransferase family 39 protein [Nanohaloarchaea archaeon]|nr:glycosyltransferase family 39 protein [Candidatus Nanohaloarchaea archaeon]